ncbi:chloride channel protein [Maridesulfovibrio hydrothermalis]|uniref:Chloride channel core n=1 Tax=Maridesulfovibrio hydrothermalis AM13 = DSM 14728 TaxID=1121451 RepID=L0R7C2_9BACT|nr:chloride channel protein [Maridesulfovibrio hydrothermalis]CCO22623.1 Chloride channel core [Maridesulfovibrio hydrothermalis AM13 = DSM 14728]
MFKLANGHSPARLKNFLHKRSPSKNAMLILAAIIIGIGSALAAVALNSALEFLTLLRRTHSDHWWIFIIPAIGAAAAVILSRNILKESGGHGVGEVIAKVGLKQGILRPVSMISALITSLLTIASGGSAGPEAPVVVSGSSMGSNLSRALKMGGQSRMTLIGCGAAGSISAIFNAPVTGMIFAVEIILGEWTPYHLIPIAISSVVATQTSRLLEGNVIPFSQQFPPMGFADLGASILLAVLAALVSVFFVRSIRQVGSACSAFTNVAWIKAGVGGLSVGIIGMAFPLAIGEGYSSIKMAIHGTLPAGITVVAVMVAARIATTSLTLGSGGLGGIFAPCLVIGSLFGTFFYRAISHIIPPQWLTGETSYALLGMAGVVSGVMQAPLTSVFLVLEITNGYQAVMHIMIVTFLASMLTHAFEPSSFYFKDLVEKGQLLRPKTDAKILSDIDPESLVRKELTQVCPSMPVSDFLKVLTSTSQTHIPIIDSTTKQFKGMIDVASARSSILDPEQLHSNIGEVAVDKNTPLIDLTMEAAEILEIMNRSGKRTLPVMKEGDFVGFITKEDILSAYRGEMKSYGTCDNLF